MPGSGLIFLYPGTPTPSPPLWHATNRYLPEGSAPFDPGATRRSSRFSPYAKRVR